MTLRREMNNKKALASLLQIIEQKNTWNLSCATTNQMKSNDSYPFFLLE